MNKEEVKNILISIRTPENEKLVNYLLGEIDIMDEASIEQATAKLGNNKESIKDFFTKKIEGGKVYLNGKELDEPYLRDGIQTEQKVFTDIVVPENCIFVMGDNRPQSMDSRSFGCIPVEKVESKVVIRFWPLNKFGKVK